MSHALIENSPDREILRSAGVDLVTPIGDPVPPQDIIARLKKINPRYDIRWVKGAWGMSYFGLFEQWRENDPRREWIQRGAHDASKDFDLVNMFPVGCAPHEMAAYVEQRFGIVADPRKEADKLMARAQAMYASAQESAVEHVVTQSMERRERESDHDLRVRGGHDTPTPMSDVLIDLPTVDVGPKRLIPKG